MNTIHQNVHISQTALKRAVAEGIRDGMKGIDSFPDVLHIGEIKIEMKASQTGTDMERGGDLNSKHFNLGIWLDSLPQPRLKNAILSILECALAKHGNDCRAGEYLGGSRRILQYRRAKQLLKKPETIIVGNPAFGRKNKNANENMVD